MQDALWPTVTLLPGVQRLVHHLKKHNVPMAIATSSRRRNYDLKTSHLQSVFGCFEGKVVCGDDHEYKMRGKPAPDIFITTAREMLNRDVGHPEASQTNIQIAECRKGLVFEDALPGMQAGKRAEMSGMVHCFIISFSILSFTVVWVPDPNLRKLGFTSTEKADQILDSLEDFIPEQWGLPPYDEF